MRAHKDEEIISKALTADKQDRNLEEGKIDVAVDLEDEHGTIHTYVVSFLKEDSGLKPTDISELSSL